MKAVMLTAALAFVALPVFAQTAAKPADDPHAGHAREMQQAAPAAPGPRNPDLPPTGDAPGDKYSVAKTQLSASPRHVVWVDIQASNGGAPIKSFVGYPDRKH